MIRRLRARFASLLRESADLLLCGLAFAVVRPLVPPWSPLLRPDHLPWLALVLSVAAGMRGRGWGAGPAPGLTPRRDRVGRAAGILLRVLLPPMLLLVHDMAAARTLRQIPLLVLAFLVVFVLQRIASRDRVTAWNPPGPPDALLTLGALVLGAAPVAASGLVSGLLPHPITVSIVAAVLVGASFFTVGLLAGQPRALRQRLALRRAGSPIGLSPFRPALAIVGPPLGLVALLLVFPEDGPGRFAILVLHVLVWAAVLWPPDDPRLRYCILREVSPRGGRDPGAVEVAGFEAPPEGALRLHPLRLVDNKVVHVWVVPVRDPRLVALDDPIRVPWPRPALPRASHVLGTATFEPDPDTGQVQVDEITVAVTASEDTMALRVGGAQTRRLVVLRPYPPPGPGRRAQDGAYRWESGVDAASRQVVDANTTVVTLRHGDVIVASSEGVARAYELVLGTTGDLSMLAYGGRTPQIEDYAEAPT